MLSHLTLPESVAGRYTLHPVEPEDAVGVFALVADCERAVHGQVDYSLDDARQDIAAPASGATRFQGLVRDAGTGALVAWWWTDPRPDSAALSVDLYAHPDLDERDGDTIATFAWREITSWAQRAYAGWPGPTPHLDVGSIHGDDRTERRLAAAEFERVRTFWRMSGAVATAPAGPAPAPGLAIRPVRFADEADVRLLHRIKEASFAEHWGMQAETFEAFLARQRAGAGFDPSLWFLAELHGRPVGMLLASRRLASEDALFIHTLGTLAEARRRGVGSALLRHAYDVARAERLGFIRLSVDTDNATGAPRLYQRAGLEPVFAMSAWHKHFVPATN